MNITIYKLKAIRKALDYRGPYKQQPHLLASAVKDLTAWEGNDEEILIAFHEHLAYERKRLKKEAMLTPFFTGLHIDPSTLYSGEEPPWVVPEGTP